MIKLSKVEKTIGAIIIVLSILINSYLLFVAAGLALLIILHFVPEKYFVPIIIMIFFVVSSDLGGALRNVINIVIFSYLGFKYIRDRGISLSIIGSIPQNIRRVFLLIIAAITFSTFLSESISVSISHFSRQIIFFLLILILLNDIKKIEDIYRYIYFMIFSAVFLSMAMLIHFITSDTAVYILQTKGLIQETAYLGNHATIGGLFAVTIVLNLTLLFIKENKRTLLLLFIVQLVGLILSNSRAGLLAAFIGCTLVMLKFKPKVTLYLFISFISFLVLIILYIPSVVEAFSLYIRSDRVLENTRYLLWDLTFDLIKDYPFFGIGPGMFKFYMYKHLPVMLGTWQEEQFRWLYNVTDLGHSHNFFLFRFVELGLLGIISGILFQLTLFKTYLQGLKLYKITDDSYKIIWGSLSAFIGLFYRCFFEATGFISHGWITRDLPIWLTLLFVIFLINQKSEGERL